MLRHVDDTVVTQVGAEAFWRTKDLRVAGWRPRDIGRAVAAGHLVRLRTGVYCSPATSSDAVDAARLGGRLSCLSELARLGVFVLEHNALHVHLPPTASRVATLGRPVRRHWTTLRREPHPRSLSVETIDALVQATRCQSPRAAVATLDSALHLGLLHPDDLDEVFAALPRRYRAVRRLLDRRAESGSESLMRLILRSVRVSFESQVDIPGVGRVDFLVDGWLIIECDSRAHPSDWDAQRRDRRRDQNAAAQGFATFRPIAEDIMWHADLVRSAVVGLARARVR